MWYDGTCDGLPEHPFFVLEQTSKQTNELHCALVDSLQIDAFSEEHSLDPRR